MKTWVLWTHYDCEVYASLHATSQDAWYALRDGWLDECDVDDCGHVPEDMTVSEIATALEYHWEEMSYDIAEVEVPVPPTQVRSVPVTNASASVTMPDLSGRDLLGELNAFKENR
jgi:hypothetical protein